MRLRRVNLWQRKVKEEILRDQSKIFKEETHMKNFKKVLALVLAVATVLSFAVMANAADAFTDSAAITHTEAVDVLTGIGVIDGFEDNGIKSFKPTEGVTRVQMAKMIGTILNDGDDINDLYKDACTFADSKSNWGAGWIAYCASEGIIAGRDANTFDPNANVTGTEAAKMLLCALGYNANYEGFVGADWAANTMKVAKDASLLKELSQGKMNVALNREDAAQMIFNALKADAIEDYSGNNTKIKVNGAEIDMDPGKAQKYAAGSSTIFPAATFPTQRKTWADIHFRENVPTGGNKLYYATGANSDVFGAISNVWRYGKTGGSDDDIANQLTLAKTFQNSITAADIYALTGKIDTSTTGTDQLYIALDGNVVADTANIRGGLAAIAAPTGFADADINAAKTKTTWQADEIAIYVDDLTSGGRRIEVIGKNYYFGRIVEHTDAVGATKEKVEIAFPTGYNVPATNVFTFTGTQDEYETEAFSEADIKAETKVLFTFANGSIQSVQKVEAVKSGEVTKATTKDGNTVITADGKEYTFRGTFGAAITAKNEYELYISPNGKVQAAKLIEAGASNFYMVMATNVNTANTLDDHDTTYSVRLLGTDGKTVDLKVASVNGIAVGDTDATDGTVWDGTVTPTAGTITTTTQFGWKDNTSADLIVGATKATENMQIRTAAPGTIVTYTLNSKGEAKLLTTGFTATQYTTVANGTGSYKAAATTTNFSYENLTNIATDLTGTGSNKATAKTTFVLISLDNNDNYVYTPVTGLAAMKAAVGNYEYKQRTVAYKTGDAFASAAFIFVDKRNETSAKTVFAPFSTDTAAFTTTAAQTETIGDNTYTFFEVQAVEGTEKKTLKVDTALFAATNSKTDNKLTKNNFTVVKSYKTNDDGIVTDITEDYDYVVGTAQQAYTSGCIGYDEGTLTVGTREFVNDDINVYLYNMEDEVFKTRAVSTLRDANVNMTGAYAKYVALTTAKVSGDSTNTVSAIFAVAP